MKFGFGLLTAQNPPGTDTSYTTVYDDTIRLSSLAEELGFGSVWTSEHHFWEDGYSPSVLPISSAIAAATDDILIGTGIALAPFYDPLQFAEDVATIDQISDGRFIPGVANGYMPHEFEGFGIPIEERAARTEELLEVYELARNGEPFSYDSRFNTYSNVQMTPPPTSSRGAPILLGGTSDPAIERAARLADGHIGFVPVGGSATGSHGYTLAEDIETVTRETMVEKFRTDIVRIEEGIETDREDLTFVTLDSGFVAGTDDRAWETVYEAQLYSGKQYAQHYVSEPVCVDRSEEAEANMRRTAMVGSPETIIERLNTYERLSPDWLEPHVIALVKYPGIGFEEHADVLRLFGDEVIPAFQ